MSLLSITAAGVVYLLAFVLVDDRRVPRIPEAWAPPALGGDLLNHPGVLWRRSGPAGTSPDGTGSAEGGRRPIDDPSVKKIVDAVPVPRVVWEDGFRARGTLPDAWGEVRRRAWALPVGTEITVPLVVPPGGEIVFHDGLLAARTGARLVAELETTEGRTPLGAWDRVPPGPWWGRWFSWAVRARPRGAPWVGRRLDVRDWAGRQVRLHLRAESSGSAEFPGLFLIGGPAVVASASPVPPARTGALASVAYLTVATRSGVDAYAPDGAASRSRLDGLRRSGATLARIYASSTDLRTALRDGLVPSLGGAATGPSLPASLRADGHRTAAVGVWPGGAIPSEDDFDAVFSLRPDGYEPAAAVHQAMDWLSEGPRPFFLFVHLPDLPSRRLPPVRYWRWPGAGEWTIGRWRRRAQADYQDDYLAALEARLSHEGASPMVTAFASLRGVVDGASTVRWRRDGRVGKRHLGPGRSLREREVRVSAFVRAPGVTPGRTVTEALTVGFLPAALLRVAGRKPLTTDGARESMARVFVEGRESRALLMDGRYKYIQHDLTPPRRFWRAWRREFAEPALGREELFDLWTDPEERRNLIHSQRTLLARFRQVMEDAAPAPLEARVAFWGLTDRLQGSLSNSGGRWNARRAVGAAQIHTSFGEAGFESVGPAGGVSVEPWPPSSSYMLSFRLAGRAIRNHQFRVSKLGLPLLESPGPEWHDRAKFAWMEGLASPAPGETGPLVFVGRTPSGAPWPAAFGVAPAAAAPARSTPTIPEPSSAPVRALPLPPLLSPASVAVSTSPPVVAAPVLSSTAPASVPIAPPRASTATVVLPPSTVRPSTAPTGGPPQ
jgi:hypothetical protein